MLMADLDVQAAVSRTPPRTCGEGLQIAVRAGDWYDVLNGLWYCAFLCAATGRYAEAATVWAALAVHARRSGGQ